MKKVPAIEVKRCFVISDSARSPGEKKKYMGVLTRSAFLKRLVTVKKKVLAMRESKLDTHISYARRLRSYNASNWSVRTFKTTELGVWRRAGGLPLSFTKGSLADTGKMVREALESNPRALVKRARYAIPGILATSAPFVRKDKYLFPIAFKAGTGTNGRRGLKKRLKADIDDGCMRSIALATEGNRTIRVYFGTPLKK